MRCLAATLLALLSLTSHLVWAEEEGAVESSERIMICKEVSLIARAVMSARQANDPMSSTLETTIQTLARMAEKNGNDIDPDDLEAAAAEMVMVAYEASIRTGDQLKQETITEFENGAFRGCYEDMTSESGE